MTSDGCFSFRFSFKHKRVVKGNKCTKLIIWYNNEVYLASVRLAVALPFPKLVGNCLVEWGTSHDLLGADIGILLFCHFLIGRWYWYRSFHLLHHLLHFRVGTPEAHAAINQVLANWITVLCEVLAPIMKDMILRKTACLDRHFFSFILTHALTWQQWFHVRTSFDSHHLQAPFLFFLWSFS